MKLKVFFRLFLLITSFMFVASRPVFADGPGTTGAVILKIPVSPRAIAMGEAFVAVADDANAVYWNPAGLNQLKGSNATLQYDVFIDTIQYGFGAVAFRLDKNIALGLGVKYLTSGAPDAVIDSGGATIGGGLGETYFDVDLAGSYRLTYNLDIGLTAKYISETLSPEGSAGTIAFDLGLLYKTPIKHLSAGFNIQNMGPGLKFVSVADPLPFNVKVGAAYKMFDDNFTLAYDMNFPTDNAISASLGGEYWYQNTLVGRFGYKFQGSIDQNQVGIGAVSGLYLGGGVKLSVFKTNIGLDYAWTNDGSLGANHHFALDWYF